MVIRFPSVLQPLPYSSFILSLAHKSSRGNRADIFVCLQSASRRRAFAALWRRREGGRAGASPRRFAYFRNHRVAHSVLECPPSAVLLRRTGGGPPPIFPEAYPTVPMLTGTAISVPGPPKLQTSYPRKWHERKPFRVVLVFRGLKHFHLPIFHPPSSILYASAMHFQKITIIGVGLLGGSIGLAVRRRKLARQTAGFVRRRASLKDCEKAGAVDFATTDLLAAVWDADLVILCAPARANASLPRGCCPALKPGAIVTDVGSVKAGVVRELETLIARSRAHFVGSHPLAGAEKTA